MNPDNLVLMARIGELLSALANGNTAAAAKLAVELGLDLAPIEELRAHLDEAWARRVNEAADIAERVKFGG